MKKKYFKIFSIIAGIIFLLFLLANFGLNFWVKNNLPNYIKNNSEYLVTYKTLDVDLATGNIFSTGITINNKNPDRTDKLGLQGTVDTLSIARLGIFDIIFNKRINTSDLKLSNPHLNIILPKPMDKKVGKKKNDITVENITINKGNFQVFKSTKQKVFSVNDLNLKVENLQMNEESLENKLPFAFDHYKINGKNLYFRSDNVYAFTAKYITTKEGQISVKDLAVIPLLSYQNFRRFYPKKRNLFDFKSSELEFKDIQLKNNKITLTKVRFENPELKMFTTNVKPAEKEKSFTYDVNLDDVTFNNAKINIVNPNGSPLFSAGNLTMNLNKFKMNEETAKGNIPFQYNDFKIDGQNINYISNTEKVNVAALSISPKLADLKNISVKPTVSASDKTLLDLTAQNINLKINDWTFLNNKLKLNIQNILVSELNGKIVGGENPKKRKLAFEGIAFPLIVKNVSLKNSNLVYEKGKQPLILKDLNANIQNIEMNETTIKEAIPFKIGFYSLTTRNFTYETKFYNLSASLLKFNKNTIQISKFAMIPKFSRTQFIRMIPTEKDLYDIKVNQIAVNGNWDFISANKFVEASQVTLSGANANIFRSKIPKDDLTEKLLYSKLLRTIKFPMFIRNLDLKNSVLVYEEDTKKSDGPGKLTFNNFDMNVKNLNSGKMKGKPTLVPITIKCLFMNASPMNVKWSFDTANLNDAFSISGNVADLPAARINPFIEPYLKITATGLISDLIFNFKGTQQGINGTLKIAHQNLKISILKQTGEKNKFLSAVANVFVKTNSGNYPESVQVENVERDKTRSFFNMFWRGIEQGLKKTLIGINAPKVGETIKKTIDNTKSALKENSKDLKQTEVEVKEKVQETKEKVKEKGIFKNIFKKKSDS
ncbi:hypothetical protein [Kaistella jeonii]|uniref:Uncharacterized protein n=1 Tax=Kaistella jeonii TaxID=266749 RepID=A0A0C1FQC3_9FLAO|nr:hypothetical protein [Kaistella jeonii]KIA90064.1 hypothetical protein OA86_05585 [Kaistella jeonii]SFB78367.1 hypothetical protein SAMN05421876_102174 [Kaistella jeonii]VEI96335.1 Uncharacterised protein [Kaistella jeonii]